ncbi:MAG: hypothetical protein K2K40_07280 [Paramuribaculum sp.]|nr:hypothetical protein [Paramuribaculum sp.]
MKNISIILIVIAMMLTVACDKATVGNHVGKKTLAVTDIQLDSIVISGDSTSFDGHFELIDTSLVFVDRLYCKLFPFSIHTGKPEMPIGGHGRGPNEMIGVISGSVISPADTSMWILDSSNGIYQFSLKSGTIKFLSRLDFSWDKLERNNYDSPSIYNTMQMTSFGVSMMDVGDNEVLMPVSIVNRHLDEINSERYNKGHIFGLVDKASLKVKKVFGSKPEYYKDTPVPLFEFFDYTLNPQDSTLFVNHAPDSLIYCYRYPDTLLYTMGFEPQGLHRDFSVVGYEINFDGFKKDIENVSFNTGLYYDTVDDLLFRTSMTDYKSGNSILQIYEGIDLVAEVRVPPFFKMLGRVNDRYYAVRFEPIETTDEKIHFILYSFDKLSISK